MSAHSARRPFAALALSGIATTVLTTVVSAPAYAVVPTAPVSLPAAIEPSVPYQPQTFCDPIDKPGIVAFGKVLTSTYKGTSIVSTSRPCGSDTSEHYDGRAIDWGVNVADDTQRAQGRTFLRWLFADDAAMVRRLGIMYVIWNKQIWGSWSQSWEPYQCSGVTACHKDHMHLSFDWSGAMKKTSFWTGKVTEPMAPPIPVFRDFISTRTVKVSAARDVVRPRFKVLHDATYRFTVSRTYNYDGLLHHRADAECSTTDGTSWKAIAPGDRSALSGVLDLWVDAHRAWHPTAGSSSCDSDTHRYVRRLTFDTTHRLSLSVKDPQRAAADGTLTVTVRRVA